MKVIVTTMDMNRPGLDPNLLEDLKKKYLPGLATSKLSQLARELNVKYDPDHPQTTMEKILSSLSAQRSQSSSHTILLVDEVFPMSKEEAKGGGDKADWSSLTSREGVDFLLALSTKADNRHFFKVIPPEDSGVLWQRLTTAHRNCTEIGAFLQFFVQHRAGYISSTEEDQQAEHLPPGRLPVWVEKSIEVTDDEVFDFVKENYLAVETGGKA